MLQFAFGFSSVSISGSKRRISHYRCGVRGVAMSTSNPDASSSALTLVSIPVSGYSMRVRYIADMKGLGPDVIQTRSPADFGGLKSEQFLAMNPLGKMPALLIRDPPAGGPGILFESRVIADYIIDRFSDIGPSFLPKTPERRAVGNLVATICDNYIAALQPYMYKSFDAEVDRAAKVREMSSAFDAIESVLDLTGPYVAGSEVSLGDAALLGNLPFYDFMMPTFFGVRMTDGRPKLTKWHKFILEESEAKNNYREVWDELVKWWDGGRWEKLGMKPVIAGKPVSPVGEKSIA